MFFNRRQSHFESFLLVPLLVGLGDGDGGKDLAFGPWYALHFMKGCCNSVVLARNRLSAT